MNIWLSLYYDNRPTRRAVSAFWRKRKRSCFRRNKTWRFVGCAFPYNNSPSPSLVLYFLNSRCGWLENVVQCALSPFPTNQSHRVHFLQQIRNRNKSLTGYHASSSSCVWNGFTSSFRSIPIHYFHLCGFLFAGLDDAYNKVWFSEINKICILLS